MRIVLLEILCLLSSVAIVYGAGGKYNITYESEILKEHLSNL